MQNAQESANANEKSSAGDKYETSRAMGQLDRDMNARQLEEVLKELDFLKNLNINNHFEKVAPGALLKTDTQIFFIAIGLGIIKVDNHTIIVLSPKAPIAALLLNKKAGDVFVFKGKEERILEVI